MRYILAVSALQPASGGYIFIQSCPLDLGFLFDFYNFELPIDILYAFSMPPYFPLLRSCQGIYPIPEPFITFCNIICFAVIELSNN
jgi:hypothetical protein